MNVPKGVTCQPGSVGVSKVTCTNNGRTVEVTLNKVTQSLGKFEFEVDGIQNPPSFKPSDSYSNVMLVDKDGYKIQQIGNYGNYIVKNTNVSIIQKYSLYQDSEQYGEDTNLQFIVHTVNPIPI